MKTVFETDQIAHLWAHQTQSEGHNRQNNFYFRDSIIFSYRDSFPVAKRVTNSRGDVAVLLTTKTFSRTTAGHIGDVKRAIPGNLPVFNVSDPLETDHNRIAATFNRRIELAIEDGLKPRIKPETKLRALELVQSITDEANRYFEFFGVKTRLTTPESLEGIAAEIADNRAKLEAKAKRDAANRERKAKAELKAYQESHQAHIEAWRETGSSYLNDESVNFYRWPTAFLRVDGDVIKTSLGADVPVDHAERAYRIVSALRAQGRTFTANGHQIHIGHYAIETVDAAGTIKAGCHRIEWNEVALLAAKLGW